MKQNTIITIAVIGLVALYVMNRRKQKKSLNPFAKSSNFTADENTFFDENIYN